MNSAPPVYVFSAMQDYKLGIRMLLKYPGLTLAGGLALAIAIGVGAGWYDVSGKIMAPTIPLPEGDRLVLIETQNTLTNVPEPRVLHDFLEWRRDLPDGKRELFGTIGVSSNIIDASWQAIVDAYEYHLVHVEEGGEDGEGERREA